MSEGWQPLSAREGQEPLPEGYETLADGVPVWLRQSLQEWVARHLSAYSPGFGMVADASMISSAERALRLNIGTGSESVRRSRILDMAIDDETRFLDVVDWILSNSWMDEEEARDLESALEQGGSAWTVHHDGERWGLAKRVSEGVQRLAEEAMDSGGRPAAHLRRAWAMVYGRSPSPSEGYREAVRAVEAAAKPVITPKDGTATLGKIIPAIRDAPEKWRISLRSEKTDPASALVEMMSVLWHAQHDRHGTDDEAAPLRVEQPEAEAALHLASTLVHWFVSGAVAAG